MTNKEKQKEMMVTIRAIIANMNGFRNIDDIVYDAQYIIDKVEEIYPDEVEEEKTYVSGDELVNMSLSYKVTKLFEKRDRTKYPDGLPLSVLRDKLTKEEIDLAKEKGVIKVLKGHRWIYELSSPYLPY